MSAPPFFSALSDAAKSAAHTGGATLRCQPPQAATMTLSQPKSRTIYNICTNLNSFNRNNAVSYHATTGIVENPGVACVVVPQRRRTVVGRERSGHETTELVQKRPPNYNLRHSFTAGHYDHHFKCTLTKFTAMRCAAKKSSPRNPLGCLGLAHLQTGPLPPVATVACTLWARYGIQLANSRGKYHSLVQKRTCDKKK